MYTQGRSGGSSSTSSAGTGGTSYTYPTPAKQQCSCRNGKVPCSCSNGYVYDQQAQPQRHHLCGGHGELTCQMCHGTGYR
jgi:hypothetical protein